MGRKPISQKPLETDRDIRTGDKELSQLCSAHCKKSSRDREDAKGTHTEHPERKTTHAVKIAPDGIHADQMLQSLIRENSKTGIN